MSLRNAGWFRALSFAALSVAACSESPQTDSSAVVPGATSGTGGGAARAGTGGGALPAAAGSGQSNASMAGMSGAGTGMAAGSGGTAASAGSAAGGAAAGASAGMGGASGAAGAPDPGVACNPADKTPDPTKGSFTDIPGYEGLTMEPTTGPEKPILENDPGLADWTVYRPDDLGGGETQHPVLVWANGGCLQNGTLYGQWLLELASHGYIAIADGKPQPAGADPAAGGIRTGAGAEPQVMAAEWIIAENDRPCSQYYRKVDVAKIAVAGQSCGGIMSMAAAGDDKIATAIIFNSGLFAADQAIYSALHTPIAFFIGGMSDIAYSNAERDVMNIDNVPLFYGNLDVGHGATWMERNAGEFGRVGLGWLDWQLKGDATAEKMFVGADCELCKPPSDWVVEKKMID